jgi:type II secretory pathway component PulM
MSNNAPLSQQNEELGVNHSAPTSHSETEQQHLEKIRELTAERDQLRADLEALRAEQAKTEAALAAITEERNIYHQSLLHLTREDVTITEEELEEVLKNGVPFAETVRWIESELSEKD